MKLLWLDLETTGLDPHKNYILEVACCMADLEEPTRTTDLFVAQLGLPCRVDELDPFIQKMHGESGLIADCLESMWNIHKLEQGIINRFPDLEKSWDREDKPTLAGNSVHFDLGFLRVHMPTLAACLHYRVFDVSAQILFCRSLGMERLPRALAHRADMDIKESIELYEKCVEFVDGTAITAGEIAAKAAFEGRMK